MLRQDPDHRSRIRKWARSAAERTQPPNIGATISLKPHQDVLGDRGPICCACSVDQLTSPPTTALPPAAATTLIMSRPRQATATIPRLTCQSTEQRATAHCVDVRGDPTALKQLGGEQQRRDQETMTAGSSSCQYRRPRQSSREGTCPPFPPDW